MKTPTNSESDRLLVVVLGPTAVGKTRLTIELAKQFNSEIFSCDSRQFYRELKIGVAAPNEKELSEIPHHFIGCRSIHDPYNVYDYSVDAVGALEQAFNKHRILFMTGGSGLYLHAVVHGIDDLPDPDKQVRDQLDQVFEKEGISGLQRLLYTYDPVYHGQVDLANVKRLMRALEVSIITGQPYSSLRTMKPQERSFRILQIGLNLPRHELYERINQRVDAMMEEGLLEEARKLFPHRDLNALNTVGYKELFQFFDGILTLDQAVEKIKTHSRRYAKRQITWFSKDPSISWFHPDEHENMTGWIRRNDTGSAPLQDFE